MIATPRENLRQLDWVIVGATLLLCAGGLLAIASARHADPHPLDLARKQGIGVALGLTVMLALAVSDYAVLLKRTARFLYPLNLLLLAAVLVGHVGHASHGAQRWISLGPVQLQPSELAKLILICTLALFLTRHQDTVRTWPTVLRSLAHIGVPVLLIARQPDLGTALVLLAIWLGMLCLAGARASHLLVLLLVGTALFAGLWHTHALRDYQKNRLQVFLNPNADPQDSGYHLHQSEIAIGSGQMSGEGYKQGLQARGAFIPEQHTDFIFTIVGEEGGFVACIVVLGLYSLVLARGILALSECEDPLGRLLAGGVLSLLTFHIVVNAGMTMGIMPVVGVPLPFFSYGLSSLLVNCAAVGLLLSVAARKRRTVF